MVDLTALVGGGVKSIQTGYLGNQASSSGTGEYEEYHEVTLSPAVVVANCVAWFQGGAAGSASHAAKKSDPTITVYEVTAVVTATDTLKLGCSQAIGTVFNGRWYVVEYT